MADEFKTNFNGTMFDESDEVRIGINVVRNSLGELMSALSEKIHKPIEILELLAAKHVVKFV